MAQGMAFCYAPKMTCEWWSLPNNANVKKITCRIEKVFWGVFLLVPATLSTSGLFLQNTVSKRLALVYSGGGGCCSTCQSLFCDRSVWPLFVVQRRKTCQVKKNDKNVKHSHGLLRDVPMSVQMRHAQKTSYNVNFTKRQGFSYWCHFYPTMCKKIWRITHWMHVEGTQL